jgi:hypothetical protein
MPLSCQGRQSTLNHLPGRNDHEKIAMRALLTVLTLCLGLLVQGEVLAADVRPLSDKERKEYALFSPFDFKNKPGDAAKADGRPVYNAGRGNPNLINTRVLLAFSMLHRFALDQAWPAEIGVDLAYPQRQYPVALGFTSSR